ncbi:hypothetical protein BP5796_04433 [Coleophoma crateriformis]|uniref:CHAT domain-containing protein n=1 Tax=Coleophoma crateriformis TaxID=565419 RepID=A0A3D8S9A7_9HELO|nr:hypothetical protein BP5796_04433 [Coleophoma crateriformis]
MEGQTTETQFAAITHRSSSDDDSSSSDEIASDFDEVESARKILEETPEDDPDRGDALGNVGAFLRDRFLETGDRADLEEAIVFVRQAVAAYPEDDRSNVDSRPHWLNELGNALRDKHALNGDADVLAEAIQSAREAVKATPIYDPYRAGRLNHLAMCLGDKFLETDDRADLDEAIEVARNAVEATKEEGPEQANRLSSLSTLLADAYERTGVVSVLDEAIEAARESVRIDHNGHRNRATWLSNLCSVLHLRYNRIQSLSDLDDAIQFGREAVKSAPASESVRESYLNTLSCALGDRYSRLAILSDLEESISFGRQAISLVPADHPDRALWLFNLSIRLGDKFHYTRQLADVAESQKVAQEALDLTDDNDPERPRRLNSFVLTLLDVYSVSRDVSDLELAVSTARNAVQLTPEDHPNRASHLHVLGDMISRKYSVKGAAEDLAESRANFLSALEQHHSPPSARMSAGMRALGSCARASDWDKACEVAQETILLVPQLVVRSLENSDKQNLLSQITGLGADAAAVHLQAGKPVADALTLLEQARGVLGASLEELRMDTSALRLECPALATRFLHLQSELDRPPAHKTNSRYNLGVELDNVINEIRRQPGFETFLRPPPVEAIQAAASRGSIVVLNVSEFRCDAIIVQEDGVKALPLPRLTKTAIEERVKRDALGTVETLNWFWDVAASPVLEDLGFIQSPSDGKWPHVWWIPTGPLSRFPVHAAGYHDKCLSRTVLDRVMSSYSSSIKAIIHGRQRQVHPLTSAQALLVAMEYTPGYDRLRFATEEVAMLHTLCESMNFHPIQPGRRKQDVVGHLLDSKIFHFAGHGYTDERDPSKSFLCLDDGKDDPLRVADLLAMNLREHSPFLAYLSACGTGRIKDERFLDESIHLISACQLAGFRHVIGTLWEVNDEICVKMARITYESIRDTGMSDESVCWGLHNASRKLRDLWLSGLVKFERERECIIEAETSLAEDEMVAQSVSNRDQRADRKPVLSNRPPESLSWAPYVHFGV